MNKKILLTGAGGFVGARVLLRHPDAIILPSELSHSENMDLIRDYIKNVSPEVIFHTSAMSDISVCARYPEESYRANVLLPVAIAKGANACGAKLVAFSSDQVYTGCRDEGPYNDDLELPQPDNLYAVEKLEMEKRVLDILPNAVLLRATWMYDLPLNPHANRGNYMVNLLKCILRGDAIRAARNEYRGLTYVRQVAEHLEKTVDLPGGVYNYGSENSFDMYETTEACLSLLGISRTIQTIPPRHNLWMNCEKIRRCGIIYDTTVEGLERCINDYDLRL